MPVITSRFAVALATPIVIAQAVRRQATSGIKKGVPAVEMREAKNFKLKEESLVNREY